MLRVQIQDIENQLRKSLDIEIVFKAAHHYRTLPIKICHRSVLSNKDFILQGVKPVQTALPKNLNEIMQNLVCPYCYVHMYWHRS